MCFCAETGVETRYFIIYLKMKKSLPASYCEVNELLDGDTEKNKYYVKISNFNIYVICFFLEGIKNNKIGKLTNG